jgi:hypothetical protein
MTSAWGSLLSIIVHDCGTLQPKMNESLWTFTHSGPQFIHSTFIQPSARWPKWTSTHKCTNLNGC